MSASVIFPRRPRSRRIYDSETKDDTEPLKDPVTEPNARVWRVYNDEANIYDEEMYQRWRDTTDVLLVFTGLFSAVVTTFLVEASSAFKDPQKILVSQIAELINLQRALINGSSVANILPSLQPDSETASTLDRWVNGLWLLSLLFSLVAALITLLVKQWLQHYMSRISGTPLDRAVIRQFRLDNLSKWKVDGIVEILPLLLHISLFIFFCGLALFEWQLDRGLSAIVFFIGGISFTLYWIVNILPTYFVDCPYFTPSAEYLFMLTPWRLRLVGGMVGFQWKYDNTYPNDITSLRIRESVYTLASAKLQDTVRRRSHFCAKAVLWLHTESSANPIVRKIVEQVPMAMIDRIIGTKTEKIFEETWKLCEMFYPSLDSLRESPGNDINLSKGSLFVLSRCFSSTPLYAPERISIKPMKISLALEMYFQRCMTRFTVTFSLSGTADTPYYLFPLVKKCVFEHCRFELKALTTRAPDECPFFVFSLKDEDIIPMMTWMAWMLSEDFSASYGLHVGSRYFFKVLETWRDSEMPWRYFIRVHIDKARKEIFRAIQDQVIRDTIHGEVLRDSYERVVWIRSILQLSKTNNPIYVHRSVESGPEQDHEQQVIYQGMPCYRHREPFQSKILRRDIPVEWHSGDNVCYKPTDVMEETLIHPSDYPKINMTPRAFEEHSYRSAAANAAEMPTYTMSIVNV